MSKDPQPDVPACVDCGSRNGWRWVTRGAYRCENLAACNRRRVAAKMAAKKAVQ